MKTRSGNHAQTCTMIPFLRAEPPVSLVKIRTAHMLEFFRNSIVMIIYFFLFFTLLPDLQRVGRNRKSEPRPPGANFEGRVRTGSGNGVRFM